MRPFLPARVPTDTSITPSTARNRSAASANLLAGHVVDVELDHARRARRRSASRCSNTSARSTLGTPGSVRVPAPKPCASSRPLAWPASHCVGRDEMAQDRGAGGRDALAADAVVAPRIPFEQPRRRRAPAPAARRARCAPCRRRAAGRMRVQRAPSSAAAIAPAATTSMRESQSASSWKCTASTRGAVHARLGVGEELEQRQRVPARGGVERRSRELVADRQRSRCRGRRADACRRVHEGELQRRPPAPMRGRTPARAGRHSTWRETPAAARPRAGRPRAPPRPAHATPAARRPSPRRTCRRRCPRRGRGGSPATPAQAGSLGRRFRRRRGRHTVLRERPRARGRRRARAPQRARLRPKRRSRHR